MHRMRTVQSFCTADYMRTAFFARWHPMEWCCGNVHCAAVRVTSGRQRDGVASQSSARCYCLCACHYHSQQGHRQRHNACTSDMGDTL